MKRALTVDCIDLAKLCSTTFNQIHDTTSVVHTMSDHMTCSGSSIT